MKVGFLTPEFPHPKTGGSGGIGTSIFNLSKGLVQLGHEVVVLVYGQAEDEVFTENGIAFYRIKNVKFRGLSLFLTQNKVRKLIDRLCRQQQLDIVEVPDWTGFSAFISLKCPLVMRLNGSDSYFCHLEGRPVKWWNKFLEKRAFQKADGIISVSAFTGNETNKVFGLDRTFEVIPNAIDVANFQPVPPPDNQKILYFGTLIRKKGLFELPLIFNEVHRKNPAAELLLIGKDSKDKITGNSSTWSMVRPLFDEGAMRHVNYHGSVAYTEIKNHIQQAAVCVFPTFAEALPVSWLEAMAVQKPVVASDIGWAPEVIEDGREGLLVHPKNHVAYGAAINRILGSKGLQLEFGQAARKKVAEKFSIAKVAKQSVDFYQKFLR